MYRIFTRLNLALWQIVRAAPLRVIRFATFIALATTVFGFVMITLDDSMVAGPVSDFLPGEAPALSLARVDLPGLPPRILALHLGPVIDEVHPGRTWIFARGAPVTYGPDQLLEIDRFVLADSRPDPRAWIPESAHVAPWILIAVGIAALLLAAQTRILATAAAMAALGAALAWHGLHIAGFLGWAEDVFPLQPVLVMAGVVLGAALGTRAAVAAPTGLTVRLSAAVATFLLLPWSIDALVLPEAAALLLPLLCLAIPALLPALVATLLVVEGLGNHSPETARTLLGVTAVVALLLTRYSHVTDPYLSSLPPTRTTATDEKLR